MKLLKLSIFIIFTSHFVSGQKSVEFSLNRVHNIPSGHYEEANLLSLFNFEDSLLTLTYVPNNKVFNYGIIEYNVVGTSIGFSIFIITDQDELFVLVVDIKGDKAAIFIDGLDYALTGTLINIKD